MTSADPAAAAAPSAAGAIRCTVVPPGAGQVGLSVAPELPRVEVKLPAAAGLGFSIIDYTVPAGFGPPPQLHRQTREATVVYILAGQLQYRFPDGDAVAGPGTLVVIPSGAWSRWANESAEPCRLLAIFAPAGFEQYFLELSAAMAAAGEDRASLGGVIAELRRRYGDESYPD